MNTEDNKAVVGTDAIIIEDNVPIDSFGGRGTARNSAYYKALDNLNDGQSFSYPEDKHNLIAYSIADIQALGSKHFATRKTSDTHRRVWRKA